MYLEIENTFERVLFWLMWFGTDAIILFMALVLLIGLIKEHRKEKKEKNKKIIEEWLNDKH